jgi:hypothetical protein
MANSQDSDSVRHVVNIQKGIFQESGHKNCYAYCEFDIMYNDSTKTIVEAIDNEQKEITLCHVTAGQQDHYKSSLKEISNFQLKFPYLAFCKGNSELMIKNFHYINEQIVMPIN